LSYYPVYLNLAGRKVVVIGGGKVAERKVLRLLRAGADVTVISPTLTKRLLKEKEKKTILFKRRPYRSGDVRNGFLVIAATDSPELNSKIAGEAPALVNVVDAPSECNFIVPSVVERGDLVLAVSTGGMSPALAKAIRQELEEIYGREVGIYLRFAGTVRKRALACIKDSRKRERFLKGLASPGVLKRLRTIGISGLKESIEKRLSALSS